MAAYRAEPAILKVLHTAGINITVFASDGYSPLHLGVRSERAGGKPNSTIKFLCEDQSGARTPAFWRMPPLCKTCRLSHDGAAQLTVWRW